MGRVPVPRDRLYGAQTARAIASFGTPPEGHCLGARSSLVRALVHIKRVAANENCRLDQLKPLLHGHIAAACAEILDWSDFSVEFPIHILHGGGGTSANMNANEVIANLANRLAGGRLGSYSPVHPLDHVNLNQSTNDVYPSACRVAIAGEAQGVLVGLDGCIRHLERLRDANRHVPKLVRTCLQDAVKSDWGRYFEAQGRVLGRHRQRVADSRDNICALSLGGGIAGEPRSSPPLFGESLVRELAKSFPDFPLRRTSHFADAAQNSDDLLAYGHALDGLCRTLIKQSADLRLLASGPEGGFMEVSLPARQPGSSAMPGKVNPVVPEFVMQSCFSAIGSVSACGLAAEHAELDLNVWEGTFLHGLLGASELLAAAMRCFGDYCLSGIGVNEAESRKKADNRTARATAYARRFSYSAALKVMDASEGSSLAANGKTVECGEGPNA